MKTVVEFSARGVAQTAGSKRVQFLKRGDGRVKLVRGVPQFFLVDASHAKGYEWRDLIKRKAQRAMIAAGIVEPFDGPLSVTMKFRFCRPKSCYGTGKNAQIMKPAGRAFPFVKPDCDKLARAIGDAMTKTVYRDDAQICDLHLFKRYVHPWKAPGVSVTVERIIEPEDIDQAELFGDTLDRSPS